MGKWKNWHLVHMLIIYHFHLLGVWCLREVRIRVPQAVRAHTQVRLICEYDLENAALYSVKWYKDDVEFYRYVPKEDPPAKAFDVDPPIYVNLHNSDAQVVALDHISRSHTGTYKCEVTADAPLFQTDIKSDHMLVVEIITSDEETPQVTSHISDSRRGLLEHLLICRGPPASVRANITWYINDQMVIKSDTDVVIRELSDEIREQNDGLIVARSELRIRSLRHSAVLVRCEVVLFDVYTASAEHRIRAVAPPPAPMMGPTAPLGLSDIAISTTVNNEATASTEQQIAVIFILTSTATSLLIMNSCFN